MRIKEIKTWLVEGIKYNWTLIKVYTDDGLTGIGEATNWPGSPLVEAACRHIGERRRKPGKWQSDRPECINSRAVTATWRRARADR